MKKALLLSSLAFLAVQGMMATESPYSLPGYFISDISRNGQYVVSDDGQVLVIRDITNGDEWVFAMDETGHSYSAGNGNAISDNGIVVGSQTSNLDGSYFKDGEWHEIFSCSGFSMTTLTGITPDGSRICGAVGTSDMEGGMNNEIMLVPAIINAEGDEFGDVVLLPHPDTDFLGQAPQYITALSISDDGHTIVGQIMSNSGMVCYPIVYREDENGKWSYTLPTASLLNPNGIELPAEPGDAPEAPDVKDYMTEEAKAAYEQAMEEWIAGGYNPDDYPEASEYMDMDQIEAYNAAVEEYNAEVEAWNVLCDAYYEAFSQIVDESTSFTFNNFAISPDGTKAVSTVESEVSFFSQGTTYPMVFDLLDESYKEYPNDNVQLSASSITNGGYVLANMSLRGDEPCCSYILVPGNSELTSLYDYFLENAPETAAWMDENMRHDLQGFNMETGEIETYPNQLVTGVAYGSADFSTIVSGALASWEDAEYYVYSYVYPSLASGIALPGKDLAKDINVAAQRGGRMMISGEVTALEVFDLKGQLVYSVSAPAAVLDTRLSGGVYIARTTAADGSVKTFKLFF